MKIVKVISNKNPQKKIETIRLSHSILIQMKLIVMKIMTLSKLFNCKYNTKN